MICSCLSMPNCIIPMFKVLQASILLHVACSVFCPCCAVIASHFCAVVAASSEHPCGPVVRIYSASHLKNFLHMELELTLWLHSHACDLPEVQISCAFSTPNPCVDQRAGSRVLMSGPL